MIAVGARGLGGLERTLGRLAELNLRRAVSAVQIFGIETHIEAVAALARPENIRS